MWNRSLAAIGAVALAVGLTGCPDPQSWIQILDGSIYVPGKGSYYVRFDVKGDATSDRANGAFSIGKNGEGDFSVKKNSSGYSVTGASRDCFPSQNGGTVCDDLTDFKLAVNPSSTPGVNRIVGAMGTVKDNIAWDLETYFDVDGNLIVYGVIQSADKGTINVDLVMDKFGHISNPPNSFQYRGKIANLDGNVETSLSAYMPEDIGSLFMILSAIHVLTA